MVQEICAEYKSEVSKVDLGNKHSREQAVEIPKSENDLPQGRWRRQEPQSRHPPRASHGGRKLGELGDDQDEIRDVNVVSNLVVSRTVVEELGDYQDEIRDVHVVSNPAVSQTAVEENFAEIGAVAQRGGE